VSQMSFGDAEYAGKRKKTRREVFLEEMDQVVPWKSLLNLIEPCYPVAGRGRHPYPLETMLRVHSDRGCQYLSIRYTERLAEAGAEPSVGSVGDSYDALAETIIGLYKTERIHQRGPWRHVDAVEYATLEWVDWFNHRRLLEPIGNVPPAELEASYYLSTGQLPMAA